MAELRRERPSCVCDLHHSSWQRLILNPLSEARDRTRILMDTGQVHNPLSHHGNSQDGTTSLLGRREYRIVEETKEQKVVETASFPLNVHAPPSWPETVEIPLSKQSFSQRSFQLDESKPGGATGCITAAHQQDGGGAGS